MPFRFRTQTFRDNWSQRERWVYCLSVLVLVAVIRLVLIPAEWPYPFMPYVIGVPLTFFLFGRWPGVTYLFASGALAVLLAPQTDTSPHATLIAYGIYLLQGSVVGWMIDQLQAALRIIREAGELSESVLDAQTEWILRFDATGRFLYLNPAAEKAFGISAPDSIGKPWQFVAIQEDVPQVEAGLARLSPTNPVFEIENRIYDGKGNVRWAHFINQGLFDTQGKLLGFQTVGRDVTDRKGLEEMLVSISAEYKDLYENAPCANYAIDSAGLIIQANSRLCEWLGLHKAEVVGKRSLPEFFTEASCATFNSNFPAFLKKGVLQNVEFELRSADGTIRNVIINANAIFDQQGNYLRSRSMMTDVTQRKQLEMRVANLALEFERLYQNAPCAYFTLDTERRLLRVNQRLCEWLGIPAAELLGKRRLDEFLTPETLAGVQAALQWSRSDRPVQDRVMGLVCKDGTVREVLATSDTLLDVQGATSAVMIDISDRMRADREVHRLKADLEHRVEERTQQLRQSTEALLSKTQELESFTYSLSHDLRAPIRAINSTASILLEDHAEPLDPSTSKALAKIKAASGQMADLMDALLALSKLGRKHEPYTQFNNESLVREVIDALLPKESPHSLQITLSKLPEAFGSRLLVRQIWENLVSNAIKYTAHTESPRVEIGFDPATDAYFVRDNGVGFDMKYVSKVFKPFERLHDVSQFPGTGVGLALVERISHLLGGRVWCAASPGKGATFYFTIPQACKEAAS